MNREKITAETLQRMRDAMSNYYPEPPLVYVIHATVDRAKEIAESLGVEWSPDKRGNMHIGEFVIMTATLPTGKGVRR